MTPPTGHRHDSGYWVPAATIAGLALVAWTHVGYRQVVRAAAARHVGTTPFPPELPRMTVVVPARNEEDFIQAKLNDIFEQDYPPDLLDIIVVDDFSSDKTAALAETVPRVTVLRQPAWLGKAAALNRGVAAASGDVVVFTDANGSLVQGSLRAISGAFADPQTAVAGGAKRPIGQGMHGAGESTYWRLEGQLKSAESALGCVVGVDGGIYAVRRSQWTPIPDGVYADDYWVPLDALRRGHRVVHVAAAVAVESLSPSKADDFERRTRIAAGIWQVSGMQWQLAFPGHGWTSVAFVSHRVLRSMVVPPLLLVLLVLPLRRLSAPWARLLTVFQIVGWASAAVGARTDTRALAIQYQFGMTNIAAIRGGARHLRQRQQAQWRRTDRGEWT